MSNQFHFAVVGEKISYSKSADIFKAAFNHLNSYATCDILSISPDQLDETLESIRSGYYTGASITIPYKATVIKSLDHLGQSASELGAVNSICMADDQLTGFNTDIDGFAYPFKIKSGLSKPSTAVVFGYGGAARAVVYSLANIIGCQQIFIVGRSLDKLILFHSQMSGLLADCKLLIISPGSGLPEQIDAIDLVVNCTPLGGWNALEQSPVPDWFDWSQAKTYYDLNYNEGNKLIAEAAKNGLRVVDGSAMLVAQALKSLQLWTSLYIPFEPVYDAVFPRR